MAVDLKNMTKGAGLLFDIGDRYEMEEMIGNGAYGVVCSAEDTKTGKKVAIKKICRVFDIPTIAKRTLRELRILRHFRHDNVIGMHDVIEPCKDRALFHDVYVALDLMESDLHNIIHSKQPLSGEHMRYFLYQLLRGLKYVHSANIIHRDLKPSNLLVNRDCQLKIGDFGMARSLSSSPGEQKRVMTEYVATRWYRAPELMLSLHQFTKGIDVWSVGCILAEMFGRRPLFPGSNYLNQLQLILSVVGLPTVEFMATISSERVRKYINRLPYKEPVKLDTLFPKADADGVELLESMLVLDPLKRTSTEDALAHKYFARYHNLDDEPTCRTLDFTFDSIPADSELLKSAIWNEIEDYHAKKPQLNLSPVITRSPIGNTPTELHRGVMTEKQHAAKNGPTNSTKDVVQKASRKRHRSESIKPTAASLSKKAVVNAPSDDATASNLSVTDKKMLERWQNMQKTTKPFVHPIRQHMNELMALKSQSVVKTTAVPSNSGLSINKTKTVESGLRTQPSAMQFQFTNFVPKVQGNAVMLVKEGVRKGTSSKAIGNSIVVSMPSGQSTVLVPIGSIPCYKIQEPIQSGNQIVVLPQTKTADSAPPSKHSIASSTSTSQSLQCIITTNNQPSFPSKLIHTTESKHVVSQSSHNVGECSTGHMKPVTISAVQCQPTVTTNNQPSLPSRLIHTTESKDVVLPTSRHTVDECLTGHINPVTISTALLQPAMHSTSLVASSALTRPASVPLPCESIVRSTAVTTKVCNVVDALKADNGMHTACEEYTPLSRSVSGEITSHVIIDTTSTSADDTVITATVSTSSYLDSRNPGASDWQIASQDQSLSLDNNDDELELPSLDTDAEPTGLFLNHSSLVIDRDMDGVYLNNILTPKNSAGAYGLGFDLEEFLTHSTANDPWSKSLECLSVPTTISTNAPLSASLLNEWLERKDMDPTDLAEIQLDLESTSTSLLFDS